MSACTGVVGPVGAPKGVCCPAAHAHALFKRAFNTFTKTSLAKLAFKNQPTHANTGASMSSCMLQELCAPSCHPNQQANLATPVLPCTA